mgnify:FL=1
MSKKSVEQITKTPSELQAPPPKKEKDPKKVAVGKKLAECNKKAKEALFREKKREAEKAHTSGEGTAGEGTSKGWSAQSVAIGVIVVGLTAINLYLRYWDSDKTLYSNSQPPPPPNTPSYDSYPSKIPVPISKVGIQ